MMSYWGSIVKQNVPITYNKWPEVPQRLTDALFEELMGNLKNQSSQGEIEISGRDDILKKALNKEEHGGRVRGVGGGSRISTCFGKWATKMDCSELSKAMESCIKAMELEIQEWKKKQQGNVEPSTHNNTTELEPNNGETEIPEGITNCQLALSEPSYRIVATGQVHNIGTTMHTQQLRPGYVRVMVINSVEECTTLPVPIPGEATVISEAKQTFVLSKELIILDQSVDLSKKKDKVVELENSSNIQCNNEEIDLTSKKSGKVASLKVKTLEVPLKPLEEVGSSSVVSPQNSSNGYPNKEALNVEMLPSILQLFYRYVSRMSSDQQVMIPINIELRNTLGECHIRKEQFLQFLAQEKIVVVHILIYMSLKNQELKYKNVHQFGFLCPSRISLVTTKFKDFKMTQHNQRTRSEYILNVLNLEANKGKVFLAPYNVGLHWILCVIDPYDDVVYYLDSLQQSPITRVDLLEVVETALLLFRSQKEISKKMKQTTKWIKIQCPNQSNYIDCGYYVMRYIKEIIDHKETKIPETYYAGHIYPTYTKELIDEVRVEWVNHLLPYL
ncbi:uncharacterized protein LOC130827106 isoform X2 [Amaranthus tricolor]|nr:uncharacterized protein LOC130827106 isoform X2 [Amaranthus tricolor]